MNPFRTTGVELIFLEKDWKNVHVCISINVDKQLVRGSGIYKQAGRERVNVAMR